MSTTEIELFCLLSYLCSTKRVSLRAQVKNNNGLGDRKCRKKSEQINSQTCMHKSNIEADETETTKTVKEITSLRVNDYLLNSENKVGDLKKLIFSPSNMCPNQNSLEGESTDEEKLKQV